MKNLENILERQHLLNDRILDCINNQTAMVDKLVGVEIKTGSGNVDSPEPNGLIEQLIESQERTNNLISIFGDNNMRLRKAVYEENAKVPTAQGHVTGTSV